MRIASTLLLGAAMLAGAGIAPIASVKGASLNSLPAVPPLKSSSNPNVQQAAIAPSKTASVSAIAPAVQPAAAKPATQDTPPSASEDSATAQQAVIEGDKPASADTVQEAKNNDAAVIDATDDKTANNSNSVVATVNDESISDFELRQRVSLYLALNGINQQLTAEQKTRMRSQILDQLEAEKIQLQEAQKKKITVSPIEVDKRINGMMQDNHFTMEQLRENLTKAGASEEALRSQITASIAWQKAVQDEYGDRVNVTPDMVDAEM